MRIGQWREREGTSQAINETKHAPRLLEIREERRERIKGEGEDRRKIPYKLSMKQ